MSRVSLITVVLFAMSVSAYSQFGVTSYSFRSLGINTNKEKIISAELKAFFNHRYDFFDEQVFEFSGLYNFKLKEYHRFSMGLGVTFLPGENDPIYSFVFPVQLEIFPLKNLKFNQLSLVIELAPEKIVEEELSLRYSLGIRYSFKKSTK
jgi:hypothetical protein